MDNIFICSKDQKDTPLAGQYQALFTALGECGKLWRALEQARGFRLHGNQPWLRQFQLQRNHTYAVAGIRLLRHCSQTISQLESFSPLIREAREACRTSRSSDLSAIVAMNNVIAAERLHELCLSTLDGNDIQILNSPTPTLLTLRPSWIRELYERGAQPTNDGALRRLLITNPDANAPQTELEESYDRAFRAYLQVEEQLLVCERAGDARGRNKDELGFLLASAELKLLTDTAELEETLGNCSRLAQALRKAYIPSPALEDWNICHPEVIALSNLVALETLYATGFELLNTARGRRLSGYATEIQQTFRNTAQDA